MVAVCQEATFSTWGQHWDLGEAMGPAAWVLPQILLPQTLPPVAALWSLLGPAGVSSGWAQPRWPQDPPLDIHPSLACQPHEQRPLRHSSFLPSGVPPGAAYSASQSQVSARAPPLAPVRKPGVTKFPAPGEALCLAMLLGGSP